MSRKQKPIEEIMANDLGVDISQKLEIVNVEEPKKRESGIMVKSVDELLDKLTNEAKVI